MNWRSNGSASATKRQVLGDGVVPAVSLAAHALERAGVREQVTEARRGELRAPRRVEDQPGRRPATSERAPQREPGQLGVESVSDCPADHLAREQVEDHDQKDEPGGYWQVGRVGDPDAIGGGRGELSLQAIRRDRLGVGRVGGPPPTVSPSGSETLPNHGRGYTLATGTVPATSELLLDPRRPVPALQLGEQRRHEHVELLLRDRSGAPSPRAERVVAGAGETESAAHERLRVVGLLRRDELEAHFPVLAKKAAAFFRKSRSIVTVFSSRRSRVSSAFSSLVSGPWLERRASTSACRTQARTDVSVRSSSSATWPTLFSLVRTSRMTSALYSGVKLRRFRRPMDHHPCPHRAGVHKTGAISRGPGSHSAGTPRPRTPRTPAVPATRR